MNTAPGEPAAFHDHIHRDCARLWLGDDPSDPSLRPRTVLFRRSFRIDAEIERATIELFAEARYHLWLNGVYLGRGPAFHHPTRLPVDRFEIESAGLNRGANVLAVLVDAPAFAMHNHIPSGEPGLTLRMTMTDHAGRERLIASDDEWRATTKTGWRENSPRRNWAIDFVEQFDMKDAPLMWQSVDFDDSAWLAPTVHRPATAIPAARFIPRPIPPLAHRIVKLGRPMACYAVADPPLPAESLTSSGALGKSIMDARWIELTNPAPVTPERGLILCYDLGAEYVGQVLLDCECPSAGVIEIGWSEVAVDGRPLLVRKGVGYVDRVYAERGRLRWRPIQFSGMRYIAIVLRGFDGDVRISEVAADVTEPAGHFDGGLHSSDRRVEQIAELCTRSLRVGTQQGQMDCPSREQAPYIADGMLTARWFAQITGDARHWQYLAREQFRRQSPNGMLRAAVFSGSNDTCVDYALLAIVGARDCFRYTRDIEGVREIIEPARRVFNFFAPHFDDAGLCTWALHSSTSSRPWEQLYDPSFPKLSNVEPMVLFIDHPGLGWHNIDEAAIDRRGASAALNCFIVLARRALADLEEALAGHDAAAMLRDDAARLSQVIRETFFDPRDGFFHDAIEGGKLSSQISEQTNTLVIAAGCCDDATAQSILQRLLSGDDPAIARNGPYFWAYLFPELCLGMHELALEQMRILWGRMIDGGATCLWETFLGDDKDTWCHPWAAAPIEFLLTSILGLPGIDFDERSIVLRPRYDLLPDADGRMFTRHGMFRIGWTRAADVLTLRGIIPDGLQCTVEAPSGRTIGAARGDWTITVAPQEVSRAGV